MPLNSAPVSSACSEATNSDDLPLDVIEIDENDPNFVSNKYNI